MRTFFYSALTVAAFGLLTLAPASASSHWECMSPAFGCGEARAAHTGSSYNYRSQSRVYAGHTSRSSHRQAHNGVKHRQYAERQEPRHEVRNDASPAAPAASVASSGHSTGGGMSGMASYYGSESGSRTASGARLNPSGMTAAHRTLPFGTKVRVTNQSNGQSVVVTINDRGPFVRGRVIDLSSGAAGVIGMKGAGVARVSMEVVGG